MPRRVSRECDLAGAEPLSTAAPHEPEPTLTAISAQVDRVLRHWAASAEHTDQTRTRMSETVRRFATRISATGVVTLSAVTPADARGFVLAPTRWGASPEVATQHARRTALRTLFRTARRLGLADGDPTLDLALPARGNLTARPLTDDEVTLCRASAQMTRGAGASRRAAAWALGEATAVSSEIAAVRIDDLDDPGRPKAVRLPGTNRHDPRVVTLTPWAAAVLRRRACGLLRAGASGSVLLAYGGLAPAGGAKAQAAVCNALREVLDAAGLRGEADVRPASLRNWAGRSAYEAGHPIDAVARLLGLRSLDATAEDIALSWRLPANNATPTAGDGPDKAPSSRARPSRQLGTPITDTPPHDRPGGQAPRNAHLSVVRENEEIQ